MVIFKKSNEKELKKKMYNQRIELMTMLRMDINPIRS